jgi:peptidoglycan/xylan/chitin deacetylase (PgdA/CDA1 family)
MDRFTKSASCAMSAAAFAVLAVGCRQPSSATERVCSDTQAIGVASMLGESLPWKTLALTFDDGPGPRTSELSTYLKNEGIHAGFFVNGKMIHDAAILQQLIDDGHVIGNHTQSHASLTGRATGKAHLDDAQTVNELSQTDVLIAPFVAADRFMFRAPYGDFDTASASAINGSAMTKYVGPIKWNIGDHMGQHQATDWDCWSSGSDGKVLTVERCGQLYLEEIDAIGRGIVLMHDPYFIGNDPANGGTVDMVEAIVPILKANGYAFVRIDEVPEIASVLPPLPPPPPQPVPEAGASSGGANDGGANDGANDGGGGTPTAQGVVAPSSDTGAPATEAPPLGASPSGGKPDPCASSPQQKTAN